MLPLAVTLGFAIFGAIASSTTIVRNVIEINRLPPTTATFAPRPFPTIPDEAYVDQIDTNARSHRRMP